MHPQPQKLSKLRGEKMTSSEKPKPFPLRREERKDTYGYLFETGYTPSYEDCQDWKEEFVAWLKSQVRYAEWGLEEFRQQKIRGERITESDLEDIRFYEKKISFVREVLEALGEK
mgnify:CR=1 FL=1